jgi:hypothetical protein
MDPVIESNTVMSTGLAAVKIPSGSAQLPSFLADLFEVLGRPRILS